MVHSTSTTQCFISLARSFKRLHAQDPVAQCLAPRLSRAYATHTELPTRTIGIQEAVPLSQLSSAQPVGVPSAARFQPDAHVTVYSWPSMEPVAMKQFKYDQLNLPLRKDLLHRAVIWEGDATRQGTASTKHRTQVRGSSRKIRPQKGTGMARLSDKKAPHIKGGGVVFGPHPRDFSTELPRQIYERAYRTALSYRYKKGELIVVRGDLGLDEGKGPRWLDNFFRTHEWGQGNGRTLIIAKEPQEELDEDGFPIPTPVDHLMQVLDEIGEHGEVQWVQDVDVKDLLSFGRIVVEESVLRSMLSMKHNARAMFLESREAHRKA